MHKAIRNVQKVFATNGMYVRMHEIQPRPCAQVKTQPESCTRLCGSARPCTLLMHTADVSVVSQTHASATSPSSSCAGCERQAEGLFVKSMPARPACTFGRSTWWAHAGVHLQLEGPCDSESGHTPPEHSDRKLCSAEARHRSRLQRDTGIGQ